MSSNKKSFYGTLIFPIDHSESILGHNLQYINELAFETQTKISLAKSNKLIIEAESKEQLQLARNELKKRIQSIDKTSNINTFTHFLAIPTIGSPEFTRAVEQFIDLIACKYQLKDDARQSLYDIHLTLALLQLEDHESVQRMGMIVQSTIQSFNYQFCNHLEIKGIQSFRNKKIFPIVILLNQKNQKCFRKFKN
jgi:hypothetical protein